MAKDITNFTKTCKECQIFKRPRKNYGKLLLKLYDIHPWNQVFVDLIGPWNINTTDNETPVTLLALMIIDLATSWFVITPLPNKGSETVAIAFDQQWLCKYPCPLQCIHDNGTESVGIEEILASSGIQAVITTIANPQANAIIKCTHQVIAKMLRNSNPITDAAATKFHIEQKLHATQWAINSTYHTTLKASPAQLVFCQDMIMPTTYLANWAAIQNKKLPMQLTNRKTNIALLMNIMWATRCVSPNLLTN